MRSDECALVLSHRPFSVGQRCSFLTTWSRSTRLETRSKESHMCARFLGVELASVVEVNAWNMCADDRP